MLKGGNYISGRMLVGMLVVLTVFSCSKTEWQGRFVPQPSDIPVGVISVVDGVPVKGLAVVDQSTIRTQEFGVFAWWTQKDGYFSGVDDRYLYADNYRASYVTTSGSTPLWEFTPSFWWPVGCTLSMFAYAPYMSCEGPYLYLLSGTNGPFPKGTYTVPSIVSAQPDLCFAPMLYDRLPTMGNVPFVFDHALTRVLFSANVFDSEYVDGESDWVYRVESMTLSGLVGTDSFTIGKGSDGFTWDAVDMFDASAHTASYTVSLAQGLNSSYLPYTWDVVSLPFEDRYIALNNTPGSAFFLLPQVITNSAYVTFSLRPYRYDGGAWVDAGFSVPDFSVRLTDGFDWTPGTTVSYVATINVR